MSQNQSTHDSPAVEVGPEHAEFTWKCLSPAYEIKGRLEICEQLGKVVVKWKLPRPYAFSGQPNEKEKGVAIALFGNGKLQEAIRTLLRDSQWETGRIWGTGWSAKISNWDYGADTTWQDHLLTPETKKKP
jgi:hypothetical protein